MNNYEFDLRCRKCDGKYNSCGCEKTTNIKTPKNFSSGFKASNGNFTVQGMNVNVPKLQEQVIEPVQQVFDF